MNKKQTIKRVENFLSDIDGLFSVQNFEKTIVIKENNSDNLLCEISYEEDYQRITVYIYPIFFNEKPKNQRKSLLHELCHTITVPSKVLSYRLLDGKAVSFEEFKNENERATSKIENIIDGLLSGKKEYAKIAYSNYIKEDKPKMKRKK